MSNFAKASICLLCAFIASSGCNSSDEFVVETQPAVAVATSSTVATSVQSVVDAPPTPDLADAATDKLAVADFSPPFPERLDLFEPPKRAQGAARRDDEPGETVELKGFIDVGEPLAVLSIDGVISPIPEGGEKYGVRVISIQPPTVIWQRGRNRRTSTLE